MWLKAVLWRAISSGGVPWYGPQCSLVLIAGPSTAYRTWLRADPADAAAVMGLALVLYTRLAVSNFENADDSAYRLLVLWRRLDDEDAQATATTFLRSLGLGRLARRGQAQALLVEMGN